MAEVVKADKLPREIFKLFEIQKTLGKGSYGTVYRAKRFSDGKIYALKEADVGKMTPIERKDAVNEIRLMASIKQENIVRYHEAILDGDQLCIVMEFAPNGDLSRFIRKGSELKKAFPEIGDLGIAKLVKDGVARTQIGTPHFMPPELWSNQPYTFSSDLWALGCLLYELMTYRVPFEAKSMSELRSKVIGGTIKPITPGKYSLDLILLMQSLLQTSPSKRPSMDKILASPAVQKHMSGLSAAAPKPKGKPESQLIGTIKVPEDLNQLMARLPPPTYEPKAADPAS